MLSVAVIKDSEELAFNLAVFLNASNEFIVTGVYHCYSDAFIGLQQNPVDIAIIDIEVDKCRGIELITQLSGKWLHTKYLVFTFKNDDAAIFNSLRAGAHGYLLKNEANFQKIKEALTELISGGAPMSTFVAGKVLNYFHPDKKLIKDKIILSGREKEILHFASRGLLYKEIAVQLGIQRETVKKHLSKIYSKLQVQNKVEAINKFYETY